MGRHRLLLLLLLLLWLSLLLPITISGDSDLYSDRSALLALRAAVGGRLNLWNTAETDPCNFSGVHCGGGRVTALRLPASALSGQIPIGTVGNLTRIRILSLRFNALSGRIPPDLSHCSDLRNVNLQGNLFSGEIPASIFEIHGIVRLDLSRNNFSGPISLGFNNLTRIKTLFLQNNRFNGSLPDLKLDHLEELNVSFNTLNGSVPPTLSSFPVTSFLRNFLCGRPLSVCSDNVSSPSPSPSQESPHGIGKNGKKGLSGSAIAGVAIGSVIVGLLLILILSFILCRRNNSSTRTTSVEISPKHGDESGEKPIGEAESGGMSNGYSAMGVSRSKKDEISTNGANKKLLFFSNAVPIFDLEDLLRASAEVLGKGAFGTAYKAVLEDGMAVAVKRLKDVISSEMEFKEKIEVVGSMDHENLVPLRAYYYSRDEKLLVYDYMPMGSLSALLHGNKGTGRTPLNWQIRSSIAIGAARGIAYLHAWGPNISHGSIKSSNILLTESYDARVSDFGLTHLVGPPSNPTRVTGYRAPEVTDARKVSQKADVYSFGVLLLELLTGKAPTHALLNEEGVDLPRWVQSIVKEEWISEVFDMELLRDQNVEDMVELLQIAIDCADQHPDKRPSMFEVIRQIEELHQSNLKDHQDSQRPDLVDVHDDGFSQ